MMNLIQYELEILNVGNEEDKTRSVKAHGFEHTEFGRLNFYKYREDDLKKDTYVVASYPANSANVVSANILSEEG